MIEESIKSIKADLYDRVSSPLIFGFFVAWCAWNYKFLLVLLSDEKVLEKIRIIDEVLYRTDYQILFNGILYPLLSALIYIFIYPYPAKFIFSFYKKKQTEIISVKKEIENGILLTLEESFNIRSKIDKLEHEYENVIKRKDEEIEKLKTFSQNDHSLDNDNSVKNSSNFTINGDQLYLLDSIERSDKSNLEDYIDGYNDPEGDRVVKYHINELERNGLITVERDDFDIENYEVTPNGRAYLVEEKLVPG